MLKNVLNILNKQFNNLNQFRQVSNLFNSTNKYLILNKKINNNNPNLLNNNSGINYYYIQKLNYAKKSKGYFCI